MIVERNRLSNDLQELIEAMNNESLIIFVGAGISQNSGMPGWGELIKPLKEELGLDDTDDNYLKIAQYYFDNFGPDKYKDRIKEILGNFADFKPNSLHNLIKIIEPRHIITTNYDNLLEMKLNSETEEKYTVIAADKDFLQGNPEHRIIKMHGDFSHDNIVLKEDDYTRYSDNFPRISDIIKGYLMDYTVLFIGYGLNDSTFKALLDNILKSFGSNAKKHYYFTPFTPRTIDIKYYRNKGIELLSGNIESSKKFSYEDITKIYDDATGEFLSKIIEGMSNAEQFPELPLNKSKDVNNSNDIWDNIKFLDTLNYVESQDVFKYANISSRALLYPNNRVIYRDNKEDKFNILKNKNLVSFFKSKTSIENFLDTEIIQNDHFEINTKLEKAFELYKQRRYQEAYTEFDKIASSSLKGEDYWNYFIAEFNLNHIVLPYRNRENNTERTNLEQILNDVISNGDLNSKRLATYFKEEILSFRFIYKKLFRINDLLDNFKKERFSYKNGGYSSNNNLWVAWYEIHSLKTFIEANCITVYQYKEFKNIINRYFECLLISLDNSNYKHSQEDLFQNTSSILNELSKDDISFIVPHINTKIILTIMDSYNLKQILISEHSKKFLYEKIIELKKELLTTPSFEIINEIENYIYFLSLVKNTDSNDIIDILENYPITQINPTPIRQLLNILVRNVDTLNKKNTAKLYPIINQHLQKIVSHNFLDTHSKNFDSYDQLLKIIDQIQNVNIFQEAGAQIITIFSEMDDDEQLQKLPKYSAYIIYFNDFFDENMKEKLQEILHKYEQLEENEFNIYFCKDIFVNGIYNFPLKREDIFKSWAQILTSAENPNIKTFPDHKSIAIQQIYHAIEKKYITTSEIEEYLDINAIKGNSPKIDWKLFNIHTKEMAEKLLMNITLEQALKEYSDTPTEEKIWNTLILEQARTGQVKLNNKLFK